ncbi:MAG: CDP-glycerol glycerophosphotransferase family protein, partial [Bacteroidota bacterium]|nr:CDP-glycerol glycerophosphotransferase family protein [Bacteroidota bacterium]
NAYAFGILKPLYDELIKEKHKVLWYVASKIYNKFPFKDACNYTNSIQEVHEFSNEVIFVPGNEVPHYLRGLKVQVFHGLAGEKKGHFRIRKYFDLYLTQGPYFTKRFEQLSLKYKDFDVIETGWPKLDILFRENSKSQNSKKEILQNSGAKRIILYAPTFSPSLTSAIDIKNKLFEIVNDDNLLYIKFHDLMSKEIISEYKKIAREYKNVKIIEDKNIINYLVLSDILISDTSSVVYEFLLLDKPVITYKSTSEHINWQDIKDPSELIPSLNEIIKEDTWGKNRKWIINNYHPYTDGQSAKRMIDAVTLYLEKHKIPTKRKVPWLRKRKIIKVFGKIK